MIPLYWYGELPSEEEELVEDHLHSCDRCLRELDRQRSLAAALDRRVLEPESALLAECRRDLTLSLYRDQAPARRPHPSGPWQLFLDALAETFGGVSRFRRPAGALALLAVGFFAARFLAPAPAPPTIAQGPSDQVFATVRSVQPDAAGGVQIAFDETRRRTVSGRMDDQNIRRLLLAAARDDNNPGIRVESVDMLRSAGASDEIRNALLNAVAHDPNAGVRLKAVEGLKALATDPRVRQTLASVLLTDENPAVRMQVIDLLVTRRDDSIVGALQNAVQKESNSYVRQKCEKALKDWNASIGTF